MIRKSLALAMLAGTIIISSPNAAYAGAEISAGNYIFENTEIPGVEIPQIVLTDQEIELVSRVVMSEAEGESEYGKRLVADTVLNRIESANFPDTVSGVIYQEGQYDCVHAKRFNRHLSNDILQLVREECMFRTNNAVGYFRTGKYHKYGAPILKEGHHYFSGCE